MGMNIDPGVSTFDAPVSLGLERLGMIQRPYPDGDMSRFPVLKRYGAAAFPAKSPVREGAFPPIWLALRESKFLMPKHHRRSEQVAKRTLAMTAMAISGAKGGVLGLISHGTAQTPSTYRTMV